MDGFMNTEAVKDSTVVERTVSRDYYQWTIDPNTGLPVIVEPDTVQHSFQNVHLTEGMYGTYSHLGNMGSPRLSRLYFEREPITNFMFDTPYDFWIKNPHLYLKCSGATLLSSTSSNSGIYSLGVFQPQYNLNNHCLL